MSEIERATRTAGFLRATGPGLAALRAGFDSAAREAQELLADAAFADRVDALPFRPEQTVYAVGDSNIDDLQSWAEILRHLLDPRRPGHRVQVINGGLSAHTTAMVLRRCNTDICALTGAVRRFDDPVVDLSEVIGMPPDPDLLGTDGVHVTIRGHAAIAAAVVDRLAPGQGHSTVEHAVTGRVGATP